MNQVPQPGTLVLLRHGESLWNATNQFTGWVDVPLTERGFVEANKAGTLLLNAGILPDIVYTSLLRRAIITTNIALDVVGRGWIPVVRAWELNERHYGSLQGLNKAQIKDQFGEEQFMAWRRSYDVPPPPIDPDSEFSQSHDVRYAGLPAVPLTECLKDVVARIVPYFEGVIAPHLAAGATILIGAHGNSLRALVKHLDGIGDDAISELNIPTGIPLVYRFAAGSGQGLVVTNPGGSYLDPHAAAAGAAEVAHQGEK